MNDYRDLAHRIHAFGFNVTAISGGKRPGHRWQELQDVRQTAGDLDRLPWGAATGLGVVSGVGGLRVFDFDKAPDLVPAAVVLRVLGLPDGYEWLWRSGSGNGWGLAVLCFEDIPAGILCTNGDGPGVFRAEGNGFDHLELRWRECQTLLPPSQHPSGPGYRWHNGPPSASPATVTAAQVVAAFQSVTVRPTARQSLAHPPNGNGHGSSYGAAALRDELDHLARATEGTRNDKLNMAAFSLGQLVAGGELDRAEVAQGLLAVARRIGLDDREAEATIRSGLDAGAREPRTAPPPLAAALRTYATVPNECPGWLEDDAAGVDAPFELPARLAAIPKPDLSECPPLPGSAQLDPALGADASPWLDAYLGFSRKWAPRAYDGFHEAVGLWVLSTVAARRVKLDLGGERYPSLYLANVARSSVWTKSTAHHIGAALLAACGLSFLLAPDEATPQALLSRMSTPPTVTDWDAKPAEEQERAALALAFAGQKGWDYDEFGSKVSAMMRDSGSMADFRGILRRFDDALDKYVYDTVGRGENRLTRPYLALLGSMTPAEMVPHAKRGGALWNDGFWARFAFVAPSPDDRPTKGRFPEGPRVVPVDLVQGLRAWHDRLGVPDVDVVQRKDGDGKPTRDFDVTVIARPATACALAAGVEDAFYSYHDALTTVAADSDNQDLDGNYSRFAEKALRVAILLASLENGGVIELRHWARAQAIAERWRQSLHNLYLTLSAGQHEDARNEDRVIEIVRRLGAATPTDIRRRAPDLSTSEAASILERLASAGALQVLEMTRKGTPRYGIGES